MKLAGALPKGDGNGLASLDRVVANDPDTRHVLIAVVSTRKLITDIETGDVEAQMKIDRVERLLAEDAELAEKMLRRALQKRSGETVLPIDVADEISEIFREAAIDVHDDRSEQ